MTELAIAHKDRAHSAVAEHRRRPEEVHPEDLRRLLEYDRDTGVLYWWVTLSNRAVAGSIAGCADKRSGYVRVSVRGRLYHAHRVVWAIVHGAWPEAYIDHIDGDKHNNRIANLRLSSRQLNAANRLKRRKGLKGVTQKRSDGRWIAQIGGNMKKYLGTFDTEQEAHEAYKKEAVVRFGKFARFE